MKKYLKSSALVLLYFSLYLGIQMFVTVIFTVAETVKYVTNTNSKSLSITDEALNVIQNEVLKNTTWILLISILISIPLYVLISRITRESFKQICSFNKISLTDVALSSVAGISLGTFILLALSYINSVFPLDKLPGNYDDLIGKIMSGNFYITFLAVGILGPVMEEVVFRGFILKELRKIMPVSAAVCMQAVLFGVIHFNIVQSSYAFVMGLVLGAALVATKTIWAPILMHLSFNSLNVVLSRLSIDQQLEQYGVPLMVGSFIVVLSSIFILWKKQYRMT